MAVLVALLVALMRLSRMFRARRDATRVAIGNLDSAVVERLEKWAGDVTGARRLQSLP